MPNHFHFLIHTNDKSIIPLKIGSLQLSQLSDGIRKLLSNYAAAINKQQNTTGSLFRQKTKAQMLENISENYPLIAFHYIHQNPLEAGLVKQLKDWEFSSYRDHAGLRNGTLCDKNQAKQLIAANWKDIEQETYAFYRNKKGLPGY